jgi:flavodoxin
MTQILVVYYSRTGFTRTIARQIARACSADLESIEDVTGRSGPAGYARSALEAALHLETPIQRAKHVPGDYDIVVIGTPIWFWNVASPARSYIKTHRHLFRRVAFFCTYGGSGQAKVLCDLESLCGRPAVVTLAVADRDITGKLYHDRLSKFASALRNSSRLRGRRGRSQRALGKSSIGL